MSRILLFVLLLVSMASGQTQITGQGQIAGQGNITMAAGTPPGPAGMPWAGILDPSRATDWSKAGVPGGIPNVTTICPYIPSSGIPPSGIVQWKPSTAYLSGNQISDSNGNLQQVSSSGTSGSYGLNSGGLPNHPTWNTTVGGNTTDGGVIWALQSAMPTTVNTGATYNGTDAMNFRQAAMNCGSVGPATVIKLTAGTYVFTYSLGLQGASNIVLRGAGPMQTKLMFYNQGSCQHLVYICISPPVGAPLSENPTAYRCGADWTGGYAQNTTNIQVANPRGSPYAPLTCTFSTSLTPLSNVSSAPGQIIYGSLIYLDQNEDSIGICPASGGTGNCQGVAGATASGQTATIVTTMPHGFSVTQKVAISEVTSSKSRWTANTPYALGQFIRDSSGYVIEKVTTAGTSGTAEPNWTRGALPNTPTTDNTVVWTLAGCVASNGTTGGIAGTATATDASNGTSCFSSISNPTPAKPNNDSVTQVCGGPGVYGPGNTVSPNYSIGCQWWQVSDIGCIVSSAYVTAASCGSNPIIAFQFNLPATIPPESTPSGGGYAGADPGGPFDNGQGQTNPGNGGPVIFLGSATAGRRCQNVGNWNTRNPPGDMQCIPAATGVPTGESSRRNTMEAHVVTNCTPNCTNPTSITIDPPIINTNWRASQNPAIYWIPHVVNVGVEDLTIDGMYDTSSAMQLSSLEIFACYSCWVRNVRSIWGGRTHMWIQDSVRVEVRDSYLYGAKNGQSTSYGIDTAQTTSLLLINNIYQNVVAPNMPESDVGNVEAYNYMVESGYNPGDSNISLHYISHGFVSSNLHEGTDANEMDSDNNHGTGWNSVFFRNREHGVDFPAREAPNGQNTVTSNAYNRFPSYVGNVLGWPSLNTNYELSLRPPRGTANLVWGFGSGWIYPPDDPIVHNSALRWGNYDTATGQTRWCGTGSEGAGICDCGSATTNIAPYQCALQAEIPQVSFPGGINANPIPANHSLPPSFFLSARPAFWTTTWGTPPWPAIGPDIAASGPLDTTCPPTSPNFPYPCDGVNHMSYQTPSQMCFINTPIDSSYQYSFSVTGLNFYANGTAVPGTTPAYQAAYGGAVVLTVSGLDPTPGAGIWNITGIRNNRMLDITGINPAGYNGIFVNMAVCGKTGQHLGAVDCTNLSPPNQTIMYTLKNGSSNPGPWVSGGTVSGPDIRAFDAKTCYPNENIP